MALLMFDDRIDGERFAALTHLSGDKAVVHIKKPDSLVGDDPEAWLMNSYKMSPYQTHRRKELKLGKYPARLVEFSWKVLGKPIRTIDLTAYKDGYFYSLTVTMKEEFVDDTRKEFDVVVGSFMLSDKVVNLEELKPWKEQIPAGFPFDIIDLFGIEKVTSVLGREPPTGKRALTVLYNVKKEKTYEEVIAYYHDLLKDSTDLKFSKDSERTRIYGTKSGYYFEIELRYYKTMKETTATIRTYKRG